MMAPVFLLTLALISTILQAMWEVWQSTIGVYPFFDGSWMVNDNNLGHELFDFFGGINHGISCNESSLDFVNFELDVETDVVYGVGELNLFVVHFDGFNVSFKVSWSENDVGFLSKNSSFDSADSKCSVSFDFVNVIDGDSQWLLNRSF